MSSLLIGSSEGIRYLSPSQAVKKSEIGSLITGHSTPLKNIRSLEIAQDGEFSTAWFTNSLDELGYIRAQKNDFSNGQSALVLPAKQASSFAVCVSQPSPSNGNVSWQMLMSNDRQGNLKMLQQASDTGLWKPEPFYVPSNTENFEVESYTITFKIQTDEGLPVASGKAFIASASAVEATLNGMSCTVTPDGDWYGIDDSGSLDLIVPTQSLGAQSLTVSKIVNSDGEPIDTKPFVHDPSTKPMQKMHEKLASFEKVEDLARAKTEAGAPLISGSPDSNDLSQALKCFNILGAAYARVPRDGTSALVKGFKRAELVEEAAAVKIEELVMDKWQWLKEKVRDAINWAVDTAGE